MNAITRMRISTRGVEELQDITAAVRRTVRAAGVGNGSCLIFVPHTTAGVTINENADPSVRADMLKGLQRAVPAAQDFAHAEGNSPAHIKASIVGSHAHCIIENGDLLLGTWQGIYLAEFDGPRTRELIIQINGTDSESTNKGECS